MGMQQQTLRAQTPGPSTFATPAAGATPSGPQEQPSHATPSQNQNAPPPISPAVQTLRRATSLGGVTSQALPQTNFEIPVTTPAAPGGDGNSKFFHQSVNAKRASLRIHRVKKTDGQWEDDPKTIADLGIEFFHNLLSDNMNYNAAYWQLLKSELSNCIPNRIRIITSCRRYRKLRKLRQLFVPYF